jgi:translation elongation factor P/translation initiation factor 5A
MNLKATFPVIIAALVTSSLSAQRETYTVAKADFCTNQYDEFAPVYYRNGLIFCTNRNSGMTKYSTLGDKAFFKIYFVDSIDNGRWRNPKLFSTDLKSKLNDGPATFNSTYDTIYFSRNLVIDKRVRDILPARNKLGIFFAVRNGEKWIKIREMRINNEWYNVTTPCLSPDGKRIYFSSDKPDGYGGTDLYYCDWEVDHWTDPVNLGPEINTAGNESYPFINGIDELFFSSDGHNGLGGKDIYYSRKRDEKWLFPVRLDPPVNSTYDDFGLITDSFVNKGYFSSNRDVSLDIYQFTTNFQQIFYTDIQKENRYCFRLTDSGSIKIDTMKLVYMWDFGDMGKAQGDTVYHCFPGSGKYKISLDIIDRINGQLFFTKSVYNLNLKTYEQPYINSPDAVRIGESVEFDAYRSYLPGYRVLSYLWDFGAGNRLDGGKVNYTFNTSGEHKVNLVLKLKSLSTGDVHNTGVTKKVVVFNPSESMTEYLTEMDSLWSVVMDISDYDNASMETEYSADNDLLQPAIYRIELLSSQSRIENENSYFRGIPAKYSVLGIHNPEMEQYRYVLDEEYLTLMEAYPAYRELSSMGFKDAVVKLQVIEDPVQKELFNLKKRYGLLSETYFDSYNRLKPGAYLMLDQILIFMNRHPNIGIEIAVYTDSSGSPARNLSQSQLHAQMMVNYLVNRGVSNNRLVAKGYGDSKPIASNNVERERRLNRRIDFRLIMD